MKESDDRAESFHVLTYTKTALAWKASETLTEGRFWQAGVAVGLTKGYPIAGRISERLERPWSETKACAASFVSGSLVD